MQAMPRIPGVASGRIVSAGAALVIGAGLALYQLTSLVLGPVSSRQLDLSLTIPAVEAQDLSERMIGNVKIVVGTLATPAAPASRATRVKGSPRAASAPAPKTPSHPQPLPIPSPLAREGHGGGSQSGPAKVPVDD
jgi:hypothetical protein